MEVILTKDVNKIGRLGSVVKVKDGFARNFLFPNGLAIEANASNMAKLEQNRKKLEQEQEKKKEEAVNLKKRLDVFSLTLSALVQSDETLYGSIAAVDICNALKEEGIEIDKSCIILESPIKSLGIYEIPFKLHHEVEGKLKVWIVKK